MLIQYGYCTTIFYIIRHRLTEEGGKGEKGGTEGATQPQLEGHVINDYMV